MADLRLLEFVLLGATFEIRTGLDWLGQAEPGAEGPYPAEDLLALVSGAERDGDEFVLRLDASLEDERLPFRLSVSTGARFLIVDEPELTAERAETTLVFMAFPYLRETIWTLTGRSPYPAYAVPPLTKLPDKPVRGDEPLIITRRARDELEADVTAEADADDIESGSGDDDPPEPA
jgi:hypothetical protein